MSAGQGRVDVEIESKARTRTVPAKATRTPARAVARTTATTSSRRAPRLPSVRPPLPGRHASASRSSPTRDPSPRRTPTSARPTRSASSTCARTERLVEAEVETGLGDAIVYGSAAIEGEACQLAVMDFAFMGGSMGSVVGEKFARACERARLRVPSSRVGLGRGADAGGSSRDAAPEDDLRDRGAARVGGGALSVLTHPTTGRRPGELREPRRRRPRRAVH